MSRRIALLCLMLFITAGTTLLAQTAGTGEVFYERGGAKELLNLDNEDWSFYVDQENQIYYIDFETIKVNLSDIVIKNQSGDVIFKDDVVDLPVNTIYELDFTPYGTGNYEIELHSFTGAIAKKVTIK